MGAVVLRVGARLRASAGGQRCWSPSSSPSAAERSSSLAAGARRDRERARPVHGGGGRRPRCDWSLNNSDGRAIDEIAGLPSVDGVEFLTFIGADVAGNDTLNAFVGEALGPAARLVDGRFADPSAPHEFIANLTFVEEMGATVGERFPVETQTQEQVSGNRFDEPGRGPPFEATLVGIVDTPDDMDDPTAKVVFPPALLDGDVGVVTTLMVIDLTSGADRDDLRAEIDALPGGSELGVDPFMVVSPTVRNAVSAQAQGLWVITGVGVLAGVEATLGQILGARRAACRTTIVVGSPRSGPAVRQMLGEAAGRASIPTAAGLLAGLLIAMLASRSVPARYSCVASSRTWVRGSMPRSLGPDCGRAARGPRRLGTDRGTEWPSGRRAACTLVAARRRGRRTAGPRPPGRPGSDSRSRAPGPSPGVRGGRDRRLQPGSCSAWSARWCTR